jgi:hypothetical protein
VYKIFLCKVNIINMAAVRNFEVIQNLKQPLNSSQKVNDDDYNDNDDSLQKRQLYFEHYTLYRKCCSLKLEA